MTAASVQHVDRIHAAVEGEDASGGESVVSRSWARCATTYHLDPAARQAPTILTAGELSPLREQAAKFRDVARLEFDRLYQMIRPARYVVLVTNTDGIVIDHRGDENEAKEFVRWGIWLGGVWTEGVEGTNGIGTCVAEGRPISVHRSEHFRSRHMNLSCSGAPLFDPHGQMIGVLDVSSCHPGLSEHAHALTGSLTVTVAAAIEERLFRERFRREWIVGLRDQTESGLLFAVNGERRIVGLNRAARAMLSGVGHNLGPEPSLWSVFAKDETIFGHPKWGDVLAQLETVQRDQRWSGVVTPPLPVSARWSNSDYDSFYWRPRLSDLSSAQEPVAMPRAGGGLPPASLRRVQDYVQAHLGEPIALASLAAISGFSIYHFARAFKQSTGMTPHAFVVAKRVEGARTLLSHTNLSISDIAAAVGFSDQSHLSRRFREATGIAPQQFRRSQA